MRQPLKTSICATPKDFGLEHAGLSVGARKTGARRESCRLKKSVWNACVWLFPFLKTKGWSPSCRYCDFLRRFWKGLTTALSTPPSKAQKASEDKFFLLFLFKCFDKPFLHHFVLCPVFQEIQFVLCQFRQIFTHKGQQFFAGQIAWKLFSHFKDAVYLRGNHADLQRQP